ncbi:MAG TPA: hypothetical protein VK841_05185 [Polyangiaceae bacterium]|jgi:hypothetical protein|nr:hypothetical protein [Polyangiaceae bacterium]
MVLAEAKMNLELTEPEARLLRAQLVRHIVELEDELSRTRQNAIERTLTSEIGSLRDVYGRLTSMLDTGTESSRTFAVPNVGGGVAGIGHVAKAAR